MNRESSGYDNLEGMLQDASSEPRNLPLQFLRNITNNFSDELLLGEGGFGTVYKGVLPKGEMIAVKKLSSSMPGVKDKQFKNEAYHLMKLKHQNVVQLVGWCSETEDVYVKYNGKYICAEKSEKLLCLEYMPNGNLREYLKGGASRFCWDICYKIIEGICRGLHYLHEEWQKNTPIIHMDLKPANILLDNNMVPKIADFGLSRLFSEEKTKTCTISRDGTLGYMPPEYIHKGLITTKSDIFSLGVMIIEIVTGHKDYPDETGISSEEFVELELKNWTNRLQNSLVYTTLEIYYQQIRRCIQIGLACVKFDRSKRPTTGQIIKMFEGSDGADFSGRKECRFQRDQMAEGQCPRWLKPLLSTCFFAHCKTHSDSHRSGECNMFCLDCSTAALCSLCLAQGHRDHRTIQIRRSCYHDVIRVSDIVSFMDIAGVQTYVVNSARVVYLNERPQPRKPASASAFANLCEVCERSLLGNLRFCSLGCKVVACSLHAAKAQT